MPDIEKGFREPYPTPSWRTAVDNHLDMLTVKLNALQRELDTLKYKSNGDTDG